MAQGGGRLISRLQRRLAGNSADAAQGWAVCIAPAEYAELQSRIGRLRAAGGAVSNFRHIRVSSYVVPHDGVGAMRIRIGGECVATEV